MDDESGESDGLKARPLDVAGAATGWIADSRKAPDIPSKPKNLSRSHRVGGHRRNLRTTVSILSISKGSLFNAALIMRV